MQVSPGFVQSASVEQPRKVSIAQNCSNGPPEQTPSLTESLSGGVFGLHVASEHWFGCVAAPGLPHAPPGHCVLVVHGAPVLVPPWHRLPPQMPG